MAQAINTGRVWMQPGRAGAEPRHPGRAEAAVYFRPLVALGTGSVAGIEAMSAGSWPRGAGVAGDGRTAGAARLSAWGRQVREPAAYLLRAGERPRAREVAGKLGIDPGRLILVCDAAVLLRDPAGSIGSLIDCKRCGARILIEHFDLENPPVQFLEMLPADILRVSLAQMPWHWDEATRAETLRGLLGFAQNLLMEVAVSGVASIGECRRLKRLGVHYAQGGWRADALGLVPDPARL